MTWAKVRPSADWATLPPHPWGLLSIYCAFSDVNKIAYFLLQVNEPYLICILNIFFDRSSKWFLAPYQFIFSYLVDSIVVLPIDSCLPPSFRSYFIFELTLKFSFKYMRINTQIHFTPARCLQRAAIIARKICSLSSTPVPEVKGTTDYYLLQTSVLLVLLVTKHTKYRQLKRERLQ